MSRRIRSRSESRRTAFLGLALVALSVAWSRAAIALTDRNVQGTPNERAEEPMAPTPPEDPWDPQLSMELRNPFLPPGYRARPRTPESGVGATEPDTPLRPTSEQWDAAHATLRIRGISRLGHDIAALVNGRVVTVGDTIEVVHDGRQFRWAVEAIELRTGLHLRPLMNEEPIPTHENSNRTSFDSP